MCKSVNVEGEMRQGARSKGISEYLKKGVQPHRYFSLYSIS